MKFIPVKTRALLPPKDDVYKELERSLPKLKEGDVLFIASKVLAIHQGHCVIIKDVDKPASARAGRDGSARYTQKHQLIKNEADYLLPKHKLAGHEFILTIKDHTLIPSAGIDESNGNGYYILWPENTNKLCKEICNFLKKKYKIKKLGVVATDSHTTPLRWGTQGISIGFYGFNPLYDYRGKRDIFGRHLKYTQSNLVDALSAMAVLLMGEGDEKVPIIILRGAPFIKFTEKDLYKNFVIDPKKDLYAPLLKPFRKKK
jgi:F420-0:gamma-glutamyl ligase